MFCENVKLSTSSWFTRVTFSVKVTGSAQMLPLSDCANPSSQTQVFVVALSVRIYASTQAVQLLAVPAKHVWHSELHGRQETVTPSSL
jgi:hypothetical protein